MNLEDIDTDVMLAELAERGAIHARYRWANDRSRGPEQPVRSWAQGCAASTDDIERRFVTPWEVSS